MLLQIVLVGHLLGCAERAALVENYSRTAVGEVAREAALDAAKATMAEYFRIDFVDTRRGVVRSAPSDAAPAAAGATSALAISSIPQSRRIAELRIEPQRDGTMLAGCKVVVQENRAAEHRALAHQSSLHDAPNRTPLEESEGFDEQSERIWTTTGRDTRLERELLAALVERLSKGRRTESRRDEINVE